MASYQKFPTDYVDPGPAPRKPLHENPRLDELWALMKPSFENPPSGGAPDEPPPGSIMVVELDDERVLIYRRVSGYEARNELRWCIPNGNLTRPLFSFADLLNREDITRIWVLG